MHPHSGLVGCGNSKVATVSACAVALAKADLSTSKHWRRSCQKYALNWTSTITPYNMYETGLFYRLQADSSLSTHQLEGQKQSKERITMTICCNADGSVKPTFWVIGKFLNPRCFKNVDRTS